MLAFIISYLYSLNKIKKAKKISLKKGIFKNTIKYIPQNFQQDLEA